MNTKTWPTEYERSTDASWVTRYPRPKEGEVPPLQLAARQQQWDESNATHQKIAKRAAENQAKRETEAQEKRDAVAAQAEARQQARREEDEATLKRRFVAAGGTDEEWAKEKDEVVAEHRRRLIAQHETADDRARRSQGQLYRSF